MSPEPEAAVDTSVLKAAREKCHKVRCPGPCFRLPREAGSQGSCSCDLPELLSNAALCVRPQARDEFYQCVEAAGAAFVLDSPVPSQCRQARAAYEAACKSSWVRHFDVLEDKKSRYLQTLRSNIAKQTQSGLGSLAGKA